MLRPRRRLKNAIPGEADQPETRTRSEVIAISREVMKVIHFGSRLSLLSAGMTKKTARPG
jgi:hypothetical protein